MSSFLRENLVDKQKRVSVGLHDVNPFQFCSDWSMPLKGTRNLSNYDKTRFRKMAHLHPLQEQTKGSKGTMLPPPLENIACSSNNWKNGHSFSIQLNCVPLMEQKHFVITVSSCLRQAIKTLNYHPLPINQLFLRAPFAFEAPPRARAPADDRRPFPAKSRVSSAPGPRCARLGCWWKCLVPCYCQIAKLLRLQAAN